MLKATVSDPRRLRVMEIREKLESGIREFFKARHFIETRTPTMVPCPGMEPHIRPFRLENGRYLHTSPEFAMKRLLVGGLERIFQMAPVYRDEPNSQTHVQEFTMLEFYRAHSGYEAIMADVEELLGFLAMRIHGKKQIEFAGRTIDLESKWPRRTTRELFQTELGVDLKTADLADVTRERGLSVDASDTWDDLYFKLWLNFIENRLPADRPLIVCDYPASQAALAVTAERDGFAYAKRFEFYAGGIELGNAFEELTDPVEQRRRFEADMQLRAEVYGDSFPKTPIDEGFIAALEEGMPPSAGIAIGVDRLVMLFADESDIRYTQWLPDLLN